MGTDNLDLRSAGRKMEDLRSRLAAAEKGLRAVASLIDESCGVDGLHLNGDLAPWGDLRTGGRYEEWLMDFDAALTGSPTECAGCRELRGLLRDCRLVIHAGPLPARIDKALAGEEE